ncbi:MAG: hypothetical protein WD431_05385 [Cyclobacteriaceae bacterium]
MDVDELMKNGPLMGNLGFVWPIIICEVKPFGFFQVFEIIMPEYLVLNKSKAIQELILGVWLIVKGFSKSVDIGNRLADKQ